MPELTTSHLAYFAAGAVAAALYLAALWWSVRRFIKAQSGLVLVAGLGLRMAFLFALAALAFRLGATPSEFLAGVAGLLVARAGALMWLPAVPEAGAGAEPERRT